ncbi:MAG: DUF4270 domain-containing protein [Bacteroidales bacterium]|nr:DUF4270 domain-containing protein [Bacteroidales bacterium]
MKKQLFKLGYILIPLLFTVVSCKEENGEVGMKIQPQDELLNTLFFDTATVEAYSVWHDDSIVTNGVSSNMLGYMNDPVFGKVQAGFYVQCRLASFGAQFGEGAVSDSLILTLVYNQPYGDTLSPFRVRVYELQEDLVRGKKYYANTSLQYDAENLVDESLLTWVYPTPGVKDTALGAVVLHIPLKTSFADSKFISKSNSVEFQSTAAFVNYFKGLYVIADYCQGDGNIISVNLTNDNSLLTMYYHNNESAQKTYRFVISDSSVRVGYVNHFDYQDADADLQSQLQGNTASATERLFFQTGLGVKTIVRFPYIQEMFKNKRVIIHRAELVATRMDDSDTNKYKVPSSLLVNYYDTVKKYLVTVPDYTLGSDYFGGVYNKKTDEYRIRITKQLQYMLDGGVNAEELNMFITAAATRMSRMVIYGTQPSAGEDKRFRLEVHYSLLQDKK